MLKEVIKGEEVFEVGDMLVQGKSDYPGHVTFKKKIKSEASERSKQLEAPFADMLTAKACALVGSVSPKDKKVRDSNRQMGKDVVTEESKAPASVESSTLTKQCHFLCSRWQGQMFFA